MSKVKVNKHPKVERGTGSIIKYAKDGGKGGFRPDPNTTVLGTMNSIMSKQNSEKA